MHLTKCSISAFAALVVLLGLLERAQSRTVAQEAEPEEWLRLKREFLRNASIDEDLSPDKIVGGNFASRKQFPFMVVVHRLIGGGRVSTCGGTILSKRVVLTAGHCVSPEPHQWFLVFGVTDKTGIYYNTYRGSGIAMMTTQYALHPQYSVSANDIALILLPKDIPFNDKIQPIRLAGRKYRKESFQGDAATIIGWGKTGQNSDGSTELKYATVPIISNQECRQAWNVDSRHVCTKAKTGPDACQGDSGGPLVVYDKNGQPLQIGVVSYGDEYCPSLQPGVFTRVSSFVDWIESVTGLKY